MMIGKKRIHAVNNESSVQARSQPDEAHSRWPPFSLVSRPTTHSQNPEIVSVDKQQLVEFVLSSSDGKTPNFRWSLISSVAPFQVELVIGRPEEAPLDLKGASQALAMTFLPSLIVVTIIKDSFSTGFRLLLMRRLFDNLILQTHYLNYVGCVIIICHMESPPNFSISYPSQHRN